MRLTGLRRIRRGKRNRSASDAAAGVFDDAGEDFVVSCFPVEAGPERSFVFGQHPAGVVSGGFAVPLVDGDDVAVVVSAGDVEGDFDAGVAECPSQGSPHAVDVSSFEAGCGGERVDVEFGADAAYGQQGVVDRDGEPFFGFGVCFGDGLVGAFGDGCVGAASEPAECLGDAVDPWPVGFDACSGRDPVEVVEFLLALVGPIGVLSVRHVVSMGYGADICAWFVLRGRLRRLIVGSPPPPGRKGLTASVSGLGRTSAGPCTRGEPPLCGRFAGLDNCQLWLEAAWCRVRESCAC